MQRTPPEPLEVVFEPDVRREVSALLLIYSWRLIEREQKDAAPDFPGSDAAEAGGTSANRTHPAGDQV